MTDAEFALARDAIAGARRDARAIATWPAERIPRDLEEAYRLQAAVADSLGAIGGWKVAAVTEAQRESLGVPVPIAGPLMRRWMHDATREPATLSAAAFMASLAAMAILAIMARKLCLANDEVLNCCLVCAVRKTIVTPPCRSTSSETSSAGNGPLVAQRITAPSARSKLIVC